MVNSKDLNLNLNIQIPLLTKMIKKTYENNFVEPSIHIGDYIETWPDTLDNKDVTRFVNLKNATMIFVPVFSKNNTEAISKEYFYCSKCKRWLKIFSSVKNIKRHAGIHLPEVFRDCTKSDKPSTFSEEREKKIVKNMVGFILLDTNTFQTIENTFLNNITEDLPTKSKLIEILNNFSKMIQKEIKQLLLISSCNCLSFDEWSDLKNRKFLGITIRSLIDGMYCDFFLDFIHLSEEVNDAEVLSAKIRKSLCQYGINIDEVLSCTTDNCPLMCRTAECLDLWRIPCVLHILNLIFKEFVIGITKKISAIFELIQYLSKSKKHQ